jgi:hypothetical protein
MDGIDFMLKMAIEKWKYFGSGGNLADENPAVELVNKTQDGSDRHEAYCDAVHGRHFSEDDQRAAVWSRAPEKAAKLALIYACCNAENCDPLITRDAVEWGIKLANYSTRLVLANAANRISGSYYETQKQKLWRKLDDVTELWQLTRRTQWLKPSERSTILEDLKAAGAIELKLEKIGITGNVTKCTIHKLRTCL